MNKIEALLTISPEQLTCPPLTIGDTQIWSWSHPLRTNIFEGTGTERLISKIMDMPGIPIIAVDNDRITHDIDTNDTTRLPVYQAVAQKGGILAFADFGTNAEDVERREILAALSENDKTDESILIPGAIGAVSAIGLGVGFLRLLRKTPKRISKKDGRRTLIKATVLLAPIALVAGGAIGKAIGSLGNIQKDKEYSDEIAKQTENCNSSISLSSSEISKEVAARTGLIAFKLNRMNSFLNQRLPGQNFSKAESMGVAHSLYPHPQMSENAFNHPIEVRDEVMMREARFLASQNVAEGEIIRNLENLFISIAGVKLYRASIATDGSYIYQDMSMPNIPGDALRSDWYLDPILFGLTVNKDTKAQEVTDHVNKLVIGYYQQALPEK